MKNISLRSVKYFAGAALFIAVAVFGFNKANQNINAANCPGTPPTTAMFNIWPLAYTNQNCTDLPLIDAKNLNATGRDGRYALNQSEHDAGITAQPGDNVRVAVYFHNGASPQNQSMATARNVRIGVDNSVFNALTNVHYLRGSIKADNASTVSSYDVNTGGDISIHTLGPTTLKYVPGTTQLCITTKAAMERIAAGQNIDLNKTCGIDTNGQPQILIDLPDTIAANGEVAIGDIPACFEYSGVVILTLQVIGQTQPTPTNATLALSKTVRNISVGQNVFVKSTNAKTGENVEFQIKLTNTSATVAAQNLALKDLLPAGLNFTPGTVNNNSGLDALVSTGLGVALAPNASAVYTFSATVTANAGTLINYATVSGGNVDYATNSKTNFLARKFIKLASAAANNLSDSATVIVSNPAPQPANITIAKAVRNVSAGQNIFTKSAAANNGDKVEFQLTFKNIGSSPDTVDFKDILPAGLSFIPGTINFGTAFNTMFSTGASMLVGSGVTYNLTFQATVSAASGILVNTLSATPHNASQLTDTATVNVATPPPSGTQLALTKNVRNVSANQNSFVKSVTAKTGETVEFELLLKNTGSNDANNVVLSDTLPGGLVFQNGSGNPNLFASGGLSVGTIAAGNTFRVAFKATVSAASGNLVNSALAHGSNTNNVVDTANVTVVQTPQLNYSLSLSKKVRDITQGQTAYSSNTNVFTGDTLQYQIIITNTGTGALNNVTVQDNLPGDLQYVSGSFGISVPGNSSTFTNIVISTLAPQATVTINFNAKVTGTCKTVTNTATAQANEVITPVTSSATINIICQPQPQNGTLSVSKLVKNITQGSSGFVKQVSANQNDRIAYQIQITAVNGDVANVTIQDALPSYFSYAAGSAKLNNSQFSDNFTSQQVNIGNLSSGQSATIYFEGNVANNLPTGQTNLINNATASGDHLGAISDSATVTVNISGGGGGGFAQLAVSKLVRNQNGQTALQKSVNAQQNDLLTFQITVTNTGTLNLNNVWVSDILPNGLVYRTGSARVDFGSYGDSLITGKLYLGNMYAGQQHIVTFDATVGSANAATYINVGQAGADNHGQVQDTATVFVSGNQGGFVNLSQSKRAYNDTKNIDAALIPADSGNAITYTLTISNTGSAPATSYIVADDLSNVLNYASLADFGGASLNGNVLAWPATTIPAYNTITRTFRVIVKNNLPASAASLVNTFGNTVTVQLNHPAVLGVVYVAPKTGSSATYALIFAGFVTALFAGYKKRTQLKAVLSKNW